MRIISCRYISPSSFSFLYILSVCVPDLYQLTRLSFFFIPSSYKSFSTYSNSKLHSNEIVPINDGYHGSNNISNVPGDKIPGKI